MNIGAMQRVLVIGSPGAGKSTLAFAMAERTGLPLVHLDQLKWKPGWIESDEADFRHRLAMALAEPRWIIDGNYGGSLSERLARADTVIDLDLPLWQCLAGAVRRIWRLRGTVRPDMAPECPERFNLEFLIYIARFPWTGRPRLEAKLAAFAGCRVRLRSRSDTRRFLHHVANRA